MALTGRFCREALSLTGTSATSPQAAGGEGTEKRIDVISTAIQGRMTMFDLEEAELCYAPQFGAAKVG